MSFEKYNNGKYARYTSLGGYPLVYMTADDGTLCSACANGENGSEASETHDDKQWRLTTSDVYWEGTPLTCDHCNEEIESAYGDPDADPSDPEDGDWITEDHITFRECGNPRVVFVVPNGEDYRVALRARMKRDNVFPNAWFISDHGNTTLLSLEIENA